MSSIERIILGAPIENIFHRWMFRKRLLGVLKEGLLEPRIEVNFRKFVDRYFKHYADKQMLPELLEDSISDYRNAHELGRLGYMDKYIRSFFF